MGSSGTVAAIKHTPKLHTSRFRPLLGSVTSGARNGQTTFRISGACARRSRLRLPRCAFERKRQTQARRGRKRFDASTSMLSWEHFRGDVSTANRGAPGCAEKRLLRVQHARGHAACGAVRSSDLRYFAAGLSQDAIGVCCCLSAQELVLPRKLVSRGTRGLQGSVSAAEQGLEFRVCGLGF